MHSLLRAALRAIGAPAGANAGIPGLKPVRPRETTVPDLEFEAVYRAAGPALQLALLLAREAGLRHKAIRELKLCNCDFENRALTGRTKAWSTYNVPMTKRLETKLRWFREGAEDWSLPILQRFNRAQLPLCATNLDHKLREAKKGAGCAGSWGFHDLRRTGARAIYAAFHDIRKVQRFLGHLNPQHSWWYLGLEATELTHADIEQCSSERKGKVA
jgi:integrase